MKTALWWVRRDLRLSDNQALASALAEADRIVPVYILDEKYGSRSEMSEKRLAFLQAGLRVLDNDLRARGIRLIVRRGDPKEALTALLSELDASAVFAEAVYAPEVRNQDAEIALNLPLRLTGGLTMHHPDALRGNDGQPYTAFTPFSKAWKELTLPLVRDVLAPPVQLIPSRDVGSLSISEIPTLSSKVPFQPGEAEAQRRLSAFVDWSAQADDSAGVPPIYRYDDLGERLDLAAMPGLSPYFRFGMISARQAIVSALSAMDAAPDAEARYSAGLWLDALIRREFAIAIQFHFSQALGQGFRAELWNLPWGNEVAAFDAWRQGRTGYPLVDAAMRQMLQTGWLHHRVRLVVASFLAKDLLVDWRWGESFFVQHLLDGDSAVNNLAWQQAAGVGTGSAPYLGILHPVLQGRMYDPDGAYVRRWLPELSRVPVGYIHEPWSMPLDVQRKSGCMIGLDYPAPIVDHAWARDRAMRFFDRGQESIHSA